MPRIEFEVYLAVRKQKSFAKGCGLVFWTELREKLERFVLQVFAQTCFVYAEGRSMISDYFVFVSYIFNMQNVTKGS